LAGGGVIAAEATTLRYGTNGTINYRDITVTFQDDSDINARFITITPFIEESRQRPLRRVCGECRRYHAQCGSTPAALQTQRKIK